MDESNAFKITQRRERRRSLRPVLLAALLAFVLGAAASLYFARSFGWSSPSPADAAPADEGVLAVAADDLSALDPFAPRPVPTAGETREAVERVEEVVEQQGGIDARIAAMEQRLARLDLQAQAAAGNASRAESLLITFAARRAIERGAPLGYLSDQLPLRFGDALPNAVEAVVAAGENSVTVDRLLARLEGLAPMLARSPPGESFIQRVRSEIGQLFVIRSEDTPAPRPQSRIERARLFLESGRVEAAVAEVRNMPNADAPEARAWIADAERYSRAQQALELLETSAILEPRRLRDGAGERVLQPSPAG